MTAVMNESGERISGGRNFRAIFQNPCVKPGVHEWVSRAASSVGHHEAQMQWCF